MCPPPLLLDQVEAIPPRPSWLQQRSRVCGLVAPVKGKGDGGNSLPLSGIYGWPCIVVQGYVTLSLKACPGFVCMLWTFSTCRSVALCEMVVVGQLRLITTFVYI
ncbi:hypothetical protein GOP47_0023937 [Adiantum capillus-veneris]|uniref:Uncharacterized protein n=1 Tax=Adiantum capillus-veneris TaxID=13818 RepID=A0A9D4Z5M5_ADICA|nr:hypothetical protein GOP47_0023937 [Adiantum capillus-veneris]